MNVHTAFTSSLTSKTQLIAEQIGLWGVVKLPDGYENTYKETIKKLCLEWLKEQGGHATHYRIEELCL